MISLRPMRADEYSAYLDYFIPDYAAEIIANYDLSPAEARLQALPERSMKTCRRAWKRRARSCCV